MKEVIIVFKYNKSHKLCIILGTYHLVLFYIFKKWGSLFLCY